MVAGRPSAKPRQETAGGPRGRSDVEALKAHVAELEAKLGASEHASGRLSQALARVERRANEVESELFLVLESWSWRFTTPLRWAFAQLRKARGRDPMAPRSAAALEAEREVVVAAGTAAVTPLVSVVLPVFNACRTEPAFLAAAIASVACQTYPSVELIVVDDGSTDGSGELCRQLLDQYPYLPSTLVRTENGGQSAARNHGASLSHGELLAFLDQDDAFLPTKLAAVVPLLADGAEVVYTDADIVDEASGARVRRFHRTLGCGQPHPKRSIEDVLARNAFVMPGLMTMRREVFERVGGFDPQLSGYQDDDLFVRLLEVARVRYLPQSTLVWRMHDENYSFSGRMVRSRRLYASKLLERHADQGRDRRRTRLIARRFFSEFISQAAQQYRDRNVLYRDNLAGGRELEPHLPFWWARAVELRWLVWALYQRALRRR